MTRLRLNLSRAVLLVTVAVALGSASCAHPGDVIAPSAARQMSEQMDGVRAAIDEGDPQAARQAVRALERQTVRLRNEGLIEPAQADVILASAREVAVQLSLLPGPATPPTPTVSSSPSPISEENESEAEGEEHGNSEERGNGKKHSTDD